MPTNREALLCRYHYDPLDRLVACTPSEQASTQRFYLKSRLATEIQGSMQRSIFQHEDQLLAQQQHQGGTVETTLLATDQQRSVLNALDATQHHPFAYTPYGHRLLDGGLLSLLGFNGERPDPVTGHYLLGNGYRAFNPVLMRFNSPDSWSPFGEGGLNAYAYCVGDPVNLGDRTGHSPKALRFLAGLFSKSSTQRLNRLSDSTKNLISSSTNIDTVTGTAIQATRGAAELNPEVMYLIKSSDNIKKIKDPLARNRVKFESVKKELSNLKFHEDSVIERHVTHHYDDSLILGRDIYEQQVIKGLPKYKSSLEKLEVHYKSKIINLTKQQSSTTKKNSIRKGP